NLATGWVNIQAVATPIQQRHCWQGTQGDPVDVHAADADLSFISRVLDLPSKKTRNGRNKKSAAAAAAQSGNHAGLFSLNMGEATLLKRRYVS
ncbi:hypothetical protein GGI21_006594, partial [Coemansia aciculifera]